MKLVTIHPENITKDYIYFNEPIQNNIIMLKYNIIS